MEALKLEPFEEIEFMGWIWDETGKGYTGSQNSSWWVQTSVHWVVWMFMLIRTSLEYSSFVLGGDVSHWGYWLRDISFYSQDGLHQTNIVLGPLSLFFCFVWVLNRLDDARSRGWRWSSLLLLIQKLSFSRKKKEILSNTPRNCVLSTIWASLTPV